jgi:hypothetical protein
MQEILTCGKLFNDGVAIERLRGGALVIGYRGKEIAEREFVHDGFRYTGAPLDASLEACLPSRTEDFGSVGDLMAEVETTIARLLAVDADAAFLLASFVVSTWVSDCVPAIPVLNEWGTTGEDGRLVSVLASLCRRSLVLAAPSLSELLRLPSDFAPTLFIRPTNLRCEAWLTAVGNIDTQVLRRGRILSLSCPLVVYPLRHLT